MPAFKEGRRGGIIPRHQWHHITHKVLRQVKLGQRKKSIVDGDRGVVALMVEVAGALVGEEPGRGSRKPSLRIDCANGE